MKTIGTDISLDVCKSEGYLMMQYDARKKFNPKTEYRIFCYFPDYIEEFNNEIYTDIHLSFDELKEMYKDEKKGLDSFSETYKFVDIENPDYYDFLNLASDINSYMGFH